ncbi:hypothetical protein AB395_00003815 [Sinorhizobium fredii CCBAU 45436]|nr:hypothetical protein AB395_00003815 [Sinorhizobium fredii CCBAU 45436]
MGFDGPLQRSGLHGLNHLWQSLDYRILSVLDVLQGMFEKFSKRLHGGLFFWRENCR